MILRLSHGCALGVCVCVRMCVCGGVSGCMGVAVVWMWGCGSGCMGVSVCGGGGVRLDVGVGVGIVSVCGSIFELFVIIHIKPVNIYRRYTKDTQYHDFLLLFVICESLSYYIFIRNYFHVGGG